MSECLQPCEFGFDPFQFAFALLVDAERVGCVGGIDLIDGVVGCFDGCDLGVVDTEVSKGLGYKGVVHFDSIVSAFAD